MEKENKTKERKIKIGSEIKKKQKIKSIKCSQQAFMLEKMFFRFPVHFLLLLGFVANENKKKTCKETYMLNG